MRIEHGEGRADEFVPFGDFNLQRLRDGLPFDKDPVVELKGLVENEHDPVAVSSGIGSPRFNVVLPVGIFLPEGAGMVRIVGV